MIKIDKNLVSTVFFCCFYIASLIHKFDKIKFIQLNNRKSLKP